MRETIRNFILGTPEEKNARNLRKSLESRRRLTDEQKRTLMTAKDKSRRLFLRQAGIATGIGVATVATGGAILPLLFSEDSSGGEGFVEETFVSHETQPPTVLKIDDLYPELKNLKPEASGEFRTLRGRVRWYNFSEFEFNPTAAMDLYNYYESFEYISGTAADPGKTPLPFELRSRNNNTRVVLIVPEDLSPEWAGSPGTTIRNVNPILTLIKTIEPGYTPGRTPISDANEIIAVEACQSTWIVSSNSPQNSKLLQESFCNSWGLAVNYRQKQLSYSTYDQFVTGKSAVIEGTETGLVRLDKGQFEEIDLKREVLYKKK